MERCGCITELPYLNKKSLTSKTLANSLRRVRDAGEDFAIPWERLATVRDGLEKNFQTNRELVASQ